MHTNSRGCRRHPAVPLAIFALLGWGCAVAEPLAGGAWVDLSHGFGEKTIYWPTATPFRLAEVAEGDTPGGYYYAANQFSAAEHGGTHIDAPIHFARRGRTLDQIPVEQLIGPAVVVDATAACAADRDYQVTVADLEAWETEHGVIPAGAIVLLHTGFGAHWPDAQRYMGTAERGADAVPKLHFPGLHPKAAIWLTGRQVGAVGIDTPSIDHGQSTVFQSHVILFAKGIPALENVANLDRLPPSGAVVFALPMKIQGGTGGPLRIVAWVP